MVLLLVGVFIVALILGEVFKPFSKLAKLGKKN